MQNKKQSNWLLLLLLGVGALLAFKKGANTSIVIEPTTTSHDPSSDAEMTVVVDDQAYFFNTPFGVAVGTNQGLQYFDAWKDKFYPYYVLIRMPGTNNKYYVQQGDYVIYK
jgi:hypothetical protein